MDDLQAQLERFQQELLATEEEYTKARSAGNRRDILRLENELDRLNAEITGLLERLRHPQD